MFGLFNLHMTLKKLLSLTRGYVKGRVLIKGEIWRQYIFPRILVRGWDDARELEYDTTKITRWWSATMIIGIRRVCRAYEFCGIVPGVSEVGRCCSGQLGSGAIPATIMVLFFPRPRKKCNWLDRNLSPRVEETARRRDAAGDEQGRKSACANEATSRNNND